MLTWKIVGASKVSVLYIYIYIYIDNNNNNNNPCQIRAHFIVLLSPTYEAQNNGPAGPSRVAMSVTQISRKLEDCFISLVC